MSIFYARSLKIMPELAYVLPSWDHWCGIQCSDERSLSFDRETLHPWPRISHNCKSLQDTKGQQVPRGYIRCDLFVGTHLSLLSSSLLLLLLFLVIRSLSNLENRDFRRSKITRDWSTDEWTDERTDGPTDTTSYRYAWSHLKMSFWRSWRMSFHLFCAFHANFKKFAQSTAIPSFVVCRLQLSTLHGSWRLIYILQLEK